MAMKRAVLTILLLSGPLLALSWTAEGRVITFKLRPRVLRGRSG